MGVVNKIKGKSVETENNGIAVVQTPVGTTATKVELPEDAEEVTIWHSTSSANVWIGGNKDITTAGDDVAPLEENARITLDLSKGNGNELYAVVSSGTVILYAVGVVRI